MFVAPNTPAVVVELTCVEKNIRNMVDGLERHGVAHRPHIKTHKSLYLAGLQRDFGSKGITCAKVSEAEVMVGGGFRDVFIAYPIIGDEKLRRLGNLMVHAEIRTLINSRKGAEGLSALGEKMGKIVPVLIDIDGGMGRGGLKPFEPALEFAKSVQDLKGIQIIGLMYYNGMLSGCHSMDEIRAEARREQREMNGTADLLKKNGFDIQVLSGGNSYATMVPECLEGLTETRAGTYIFGDASTLTGGVIGVGDCAMRVQVTVVSVVDEQHVIIDAGSKTLSSDLCKHKAGYGYVVEMPDAEITNLNEEHGFVKTAGAHGLSVGDRLSIIPNHCCPVANLANAMIGVRDGAYERVIKVDARGMNQ